MLVNIQTSQNELIKKSGRTMDCLEVTLMWYIPNENSFDLAFIYPLKCFKKTKKNEEEEIFQTRDSKAISKANYQQG